MVNQLKRGNRCKNIGIRVLSTRCIRFSTEKLIYLSALSTQVLPHTILKNINLQNKSDLYLLKSCDAIYI